MGVVIGAFGPSGAPACTDRVASFMRRGLSPTTMQFKRRVAKKKPPEPISGAAKIEARGAGVAGDTIPPAANASPRSRAASMPRRTLLKSGANYTRAHSRRIADLQSGHCNRAGCVQTAELSPARLRRRYSGQRQQLLEFGCALEPVE